MAVKSDDYILLHLRRRNDGWRIVSEMVGTSAANELYQLGLFTVKVKATMMEADALSADDNFGTSWATIMFVQNEGMIQVVEVTPVVNSRGGIKADVSGHFGPGKTIKCDGNDVPCTDVIVMFTAMGVDSEFTVGANANNGVVPPQAAGGFADGVSGSFGNSFVVNGGSVVTDIGFEICPVCIRSDDQEEEPVFRFEIVDKDHEGFGRHNRGTLDDGGWWGGPEIYWNNPSVE